MQLFYSEILEKLDQTFELAHQESLHISKVLRKIVGDKIFVTNGKGKLFEAEILSLSKRNCSLTATKEIERKLDLSNLSIAIAPTKNIARIEWFIEKSIEIGIEKISLILTQNSERRNVKIDRLRIKMLSAMKQSLNIVLPELEDLTKFESFVKANAESYSDKYIAYCKEETKNLIEKIDVNLKTIVLIGPEGGFSINEVEIAEQYGFKTVSLGSSRLRTETAGVYVVSVFNAHRSN